MGGGVTYNARFGNGEDVNHTYKNIDGCSKFLALISVVIEKTVNGVTSNAANEIESLVKNTNDWMDVSNNSISIDGTSIALSVTAEKNNNLFIRTDSISFKFKMKDGGETNWLSITISQNICRNIPAIPISLSYFAFNMRFSRMFIEGSSVNIYNPIFGVRSTGSANAILNTNIYFPCMSVTTENSVGENGMTIVNIKDVVFDTYDKLSNTIVKVHIPYEDYKNIESSLSDGISNYVNSLCELANSGSYDDLVTFNVCDWTMDDTSLNAFTDSSYPYDTLDDLNMLPNSSGNYEYYGIKDD